MRLSSTSGPLHARAGAPILRLIMTSDRRLVRATALLFALVLAAACNSDLTLPPATLPIATQQITLYALSGTAVNTNSAYDGLGLGEVRTDQTNSFDFA